MVHGRGDACTCLLLFCLYLRMESIDVHLKGRRRIHGILRTSYLGFHVVCSCLCLYLCLCLQLQLRLLASPCTPLHRRPGLLELPVIPANQGSSSRPGYDIWI